jgi:hypothetical protein
MAANTEYGLGQVVGTNVYQVLFVRQKHAIQIVMYMWGSLNYQHNEEWQIWPISFHHSGLHYNTQSTQANFMALLLIHGRQLR